MDRRAQIREQHRTAILTAALEIADEQGWAAVTIRRIGDRIGYRAPIVYQHFTDKSDVLSTLMRDGYIGLSAAMDHAGGNADPADRVVAVCRAFMDYAAEHARLYQLMTGAGVADVAPQVRLVASEPVVAVAVRTLVDWAEATGARIDSFDEACELIWGVLHGMAGIGLIPDIGFERARHLADVAIEALTVRWLAAGAEKPG